MTFAYLSDFDNFPRLWQHICIYPEESGSILLYVWCYDHCVMPCQLIDS